VVITTDPFLPMARSVAASLDYPDARIVSVAHPIAGLSGEAITERANGVAEAVIAAFLEPTKGDGE
jgi:hypothetical protein